MKDTLRRRHSHPKFAQSGSQNAENINIFNTVSLSTRKQVSILALMFVSSIVLLVAGTAITHQKYPNREKAVKSVSKLELDPTPTAEPTEAVEPVVTAWRSFTSDKYNFAVDVPSTWNVQEYMIPSGGTLLAFSPDSLPCNTCTYFRDGYISIKVFNQETDSVSYASFVQRMNALGKRKDYIAIKLDKKDGVYFANIAAVENKGWVYEIAFDKDNGNAKAEESEIFQKIIASLRFTSLVFDN